MKKLFTMMAICLGAFTAANAQYTPEKGDFAVEFGFTPFNTTNGESFKLNEGMLKARYFISDKDAIRLKLGLGIDKSTTTESYLNDTPNKLNNAYTYDLKETETKNKNTKFSFMVGYERHLVTKGRFDVYAGLELGYMMDKWSGTQTIEQVTTDYKADGSIDKGQIRDFQADFTNRTATTVMDNNGNQIPEHTSLNKFVGNLFAGADFYVYKGLYLGAEFGLGFSTGKSPSNYESSVDVTTSTNASGQVTNVCTIVADGETGIKTTTNTNVTTPTLPAYTPVTQTEKSETSFKFFVEPAIRIGWTF